MNSTAWAEDAGAEAGAAVAPVGCWSFTPLVVYKVGSVCYKCRGGPIPTQSRANKNPGVITDLKVGRGRPGDYMPILTDNNTGCHQNTFIKSVTRFPSLGLDLIDSRPQRTICYR